MQIKEYKLVIGNVHKNLMLFLRRLHIQQFYYCRYITRAIWLSYLVGIKRYNGLFGNRIHAVKSFQYSWLCTVLCQKRSYTKVACWSYRGIGGHPTREGTRFTYRLTHEQSIGRYRWHPSGNSPQYPGYCAGEGMQQCPTYVNCRLMLVKIVS